MRTMDAARVEFKLNSFPTKGKAPPGAFPLVVDLILPVAEAHAMQFYDKPPPWFAAETLYDLVSGRYVVTGLKNEEKKNYEFGQPATSGEFTQNALRQSGVR